MTIKKSFVIIGAVLIIHFGALVFDLYYLLSWFDIFMHFAGGFAMGALGLGIWYEGVEDVKFKGWFQKHLKWWLVPGVIFGFVSLIGILWELHEFLLDELFQRAAELRHQPSIADTMMDFVMDLLGAGIALVAFWRR